MNNNTLFVLFVVKMLKEEEDRLNETKKLIIQNNSKLEYNIDKINLTSQERAKNIQDNKTKS